MKQVVASIISNSGVMPGVHLIWLESPQIADEAQPGQFVMVRCGSDTLLPRPLSIHRLDGSRLALLFTVVGRGTAWLSQRKVGDNINLFGPLGNGFSIDPNSRKLLMVAGGIGISPIIFLAQESLKKRCLVTLLYGTADANRYPERFLPLKMEVVPVTEDGTVGKKGRVTDLISKFVDWADQIFACGPMPMYQAMAQMPGLKNKPVQVSLEIMMGCGRGFCYGCTIKTKQGLKKVCADGSVFELDDILWDEINFV